MIGRIGRKRHSALPLPQGGGARSRLSVVDVRRFVTDDAWNVLRLLVRECRAARHAGQVPFARGKNRCPSTRRAAPPDTTKLGSPGLRQGNTLAT